MSGTHPLLEVCGVTKRFPGVVALRDVSFDLRAGEVHSLVGENGAGKSTLLACINGLHQPTSGTIKIAGKQTHLSSPVDAIAHQLSMVHQELVLCPNMTVAENIFLGREPERAFGLNDKTRMVLEARALLERLQVELDPNQKLGELSLNEQQIVEICRALVGDPKVIVFDEPTASLNDDQVRYLLDTIMNLKSQGLGIIYVSHRLNEVLEISDRISVLRDSRLVATEPADGMNEQRLVSLMVGREHKPGETTYRKRDLGEVVLNASGIGHEGLFEDVSFDLRKGEIIGIAGLLGCQREAVVRAIFGARTIDSGTLSLHGAPTHFSSPREAIDAGIAFMAADRKHEGLVLGMSVSDNISLTILDRIKSFGFLQRRSLAQITRELVDLLAIKVSTFSQRVSQLSGGNQQKVVIGKWIARKSDVVIAEDPTRGVDVGAKSEIWRSIQTLADEGRSVILLTTELQEMVSACDKIIVMSRGRITGRFDRKDFSTEEIARCFFT